MKDSRRVQDWDEVVQPQRTGVGEGGWGQPPVTCARPYDSRSGGRPPPAPGSWQPRIPSWEKKFCTNVCRIPWRKICETKRLMAYYSSVLDWDDSAGKEAFDNAKARFFAEINGLPCDISLPGPDMYIDEINWDSEIDPQLLIDLDKEFIPADLEVNNAKVGFLSSDWDRAIPCTGWGDAEDATIPVRDAWDNSGWTNSFGDGGNVEQWDRTCTDGALDNCGWDDQAWNNDSGRRTGGWDGNTGQVTGAWEDNTGPTNGAWGANSCWPVLCQEENFHLRESFLDNSLDNKRHRDSSRQQDIYRNNQTRHWESKRCSRKRESERPGPRSPAFGHQKDDGQQPGNYQWRTNRGRKRVNYQNEQPTVNEPLVPHQWNAMRSCGPRNGY